MCTILENKTRLTEGHRDLSCLHLSIPQPPGLSSWACPGRCTGNGFRLQSKKHWMPLQGPTRAFYDSTVPHMQSGEKDHSGRVYFTSPR